MTSFNPTRTHRPQVQPERMPRPRAVERMRVHVETSVAPTIDPKDIPLISFKGNRYDISKLLKLAGTSITFKHEDLHEAYLTLASFEGAMSDDVRDHVPIVAKYEGKFVVLLGIKKIGEQFRAGKGYSARLLSNPVLKNAVVE